LTVARSEVQWFGPEVCIVVERFDRIPAARGSRLAARVHQEDVCQALAVHPRRKYQNDGGPTPAQIVELVRRFSTAPGEDVATFVDALALNWLLAGTDAHAKNYALLHQAHGRGRLAPLYDIASVLPYPDLDPRRAKLAMKIGGEYRLFAIAARHVRKLASELALDVDEVMGRFQALADAAPDAITAAVREAREGGLDHPVVARLGQLAIERAASCRDVLGR
jgi:serine/threonine-protein kinase HipA